MCANECLGVLMYLLKESLLHLPNIWITASLRPFDAAVVAAPMRNECPAYSRACLTVSTSLSLVKGILLSSLNGGPSSIPLTSKYWSIATTGQREFLVCPMNRSTRFLS